MEKKNNMYKLSVEQWSPFVGCEHDCLYCKSSFQRQLKRWARKNCPGCYEFTPHTHPERLDQSLPRTKYMQFIFTCSSGDIAFCSTEYLEKIIARIQSEPDKTFLIQSKDPRTFNRVIFPKNVILGTTLETNRDKLCEGTSKAPKPSQRYKDFAKVDHLLKMVTIEPVIDFDLDVMINWVENINPCMVWLGYDSGKNKLPEPELEKVKSLHWQLAKKGFVVILKTIRKAWHEQ
jgi:DNA repair photolyase